MIRHLRERALLVRLQVCFMALQATRAGAGGDLQPLAVRLLAAACGHNPNLFIEFHHSLSLNSDFLWISVFCWRIVTRGETVVLRTALKPSRPQNPRIQGGGQMRERRFSRGLEVGSVDSGFGSSSRPRALIMEEPAATPPLRPRRASPARLATRRSLASGCR